MMTLFKAVPCLLILLLPMGAAFSEDLSPAVKQQVRSSPDLTEQQFDSMCAGVTTLLSSDSTSSSEGSPAEDGLGIHGFAQSGDVRIHYVTKGEGPLVVMIHGFPDYWYTWRKQMPALAENFKVVAIDQRGYNESDQPEGVSKLCHGKTCGRCPCGRCSISSRTKRSSSDMTGAGWWPGRLRWLTRT